MDITAVLGGIVGVVKNCSFESFWFIVSENINSAEMDCFLYGKRVLFSVLNSRIQKFSNEGSVPASS